MKYLTDYSWYNNYGEDDIYIDGGVGMSTTDFSFDDPVGFCY